MGQNRQLQAASDWRMRRRRRLLIGRRAAAGCRDLATSEAIRQRRFCRWRQDSPGDNAPAATASESQWKESHNPADVSLPF